MTLKRRDFLAFLGGLGVISLLPSGCITKVKKDKETIIPSLPPSVDDRLNTIEDLNWYSLIREGDSLNSQGLKFGTNNDFIALFAHPTAPDTYVMAVNHESINPLVSLGNGTFAREKTWIDLEMASVGVSFFRVEFKNGKYNFIKDASENRRINANTRIPFSGDRRIEGSKFARGTFANCAGGFTTWGSMLTCEENFQDFVGDRPHGRRTVRYPAKNQFKWCEFYEMPPEHYGWVVEINPFDGEAKKLTGLGRMAHEGATVTKAKDGRAVVYMGDDDNDRCLYKFVSNSEKNLEKGALFVANIESGHWIPLDRNRDPRLNKAFVDHMDLMIYVREAAEIVGGSKLDRPEDIEIHPRSGHVYVSLTNNKVQNRPHGSLLKLIEHENDAAATRFSASTFILGGEESGFSSPDNLVFDRNGNLWMTTDVSGSLMGQGDYKFFGNNSLFFIPLFGELAGKAFRIATAPRDAEFTGPCFSEKGNTLFLSVQHPGETSQSSNNFTSHWPEGGNSKPLSSVVALYGSKLDFLTGPEFAQAKLEFKDQ
jgi:secreted PhoX family phosphatase